jgi:hypothetical protein
VNIKLVKPQMILLYPHKIMSKIKRMNQKKVLIKRKVLIKGQMRMIEIMKDQEQDHHT